MFINITDEMKSAAATEAKKRDPYIKHHFNVDHLSDSDRDIIGFLGEFAACELLNINWRSNIRKDYLTIDNGDGIISDNIFDVKTETVPNPYFNKILDRSINDNGVYGRRLINSGQVSLLKNYNIVIFGQFLRNDYSKWYPIGWLESKYILNSYKVTKNRPDGGFYPFSALPIKTSDLKPIDSLMR